MPTSLERLAHNQVLFREVNERLREKLDALDGATEFLCECSRTDCIETVTLTVAAYESVRSDPNRFLVTTGHEIPEIEVVVDVRQGYSIVQKTTAGEYVEETDPRSCDEG